jgi:hypothetical protein
MGERAVTDEELRAEVRDQRDRREIWQVLMNYCRGVDRLDRELLLSCYHPDGVDDHGIFMGNPEAFADWALGLHREYQTATQHAITNHTCEIDGDVAHTESYYYFAGMNIGEPPLTLCGGRYIDRFERRNGEWRIAARMSLLEWQGTPGEIFVSREQVLPDGHGHRARRDRLDPSYERPLTIKSSTAAYRIVPRG